MFKMIFMCLTVLIYSNFSLAEKAEFTISGMKCKSCQKNLESKICKIPHLKTCQVDIGKMILESDQAFTLDYELIKQTVNFNGHYNVENIEIKK